LLVVLFTDIAGSTDRVATVGDTVWRETLDSFRRLARRVIDRYGAREVDTRGDDFFVVASTPSIAIAIARDIRSEAASIGLHVRSGIHLGEVEHQGDDYAGLTVHIGARIAGLATAGEILISQTVHDSLVGSLVDSTSHGTHALKGVPDEWTVFAVED
jgi:class 3 adenylate cyclase